MVQNKKSIVNALASADIELTIAATLVTSPPAKNVKNLASTIKTWLPGGCPISSLYAEAMNSPQSQRLAVGSIVRRYVIAAITKTIHPVILLINLNFLI
jgi:hypothetical protein